MIVDRHDNSGFYIIKIPLTNPEVEEYLKSKDVKFTRATPTSIKAVVDYVICMGAKQSVQYLGWQRDE